MQVASSQMAGNQVRVVQLPQRLKKGKAPATEKAINGELLRGPLARKAWWLKVMFFEYHKRGQLWRPYASGEYAKHVVLLDQALWRLPPKELSEFLESGRQRARKRARSAAHAPLAHVQLKPNGVRWVIAHGNLSHFGA